MVLAASGPVGGVVRVVPLNKIPSSERDRDLPNKLQAEWPGRRRALGHDGVAEGPT